jgi:tRNA nucleotidyltransferase (CCA-adding enzyme)
VIIDSYKLNNIGELLKNNDLVENPEFLNFLVEFLNPGQLLKR